MDLLLIKQDSPEWHYMWNWISQHPINEGLSPQELNTWQYTGSLRQGSKTLHQFKRGTNSLVLACSHTMNAEDISRIVVLK